MRHNILRAYRVSSYCKAEGKYHYKKQIVCTTQFAKPVF